jgi:thiol-disulfide isomerase/thioredoxin
MRIKSKIVIFGSVIFGVILLISVGIFNKVKYKDKVRENILTLDSIQYLSIDSTLYGITSTENFIVIFFFNSECDHCQEEARLISNNALRFEKTDIYFFSEEALPAIERFANEFDLVRSPFKIGRVDYNVIYRMGVNTNPMCFIYSPDRKLLRKYVGQVKIEAIVKYLR